MLPVNRPKQELRLKNNVPESKPLEVFLEKNFIDSGRAVVPNEWYDELKNLSLKKDLGLKL